MWEALKSCKLLLLYSTLLWRRSSARAHVCVSFCTCYSADLTPGMCPAPAPLGSLCSMSQTSPNNHTAGSSIHGSIYSSIHPCGKAHYKDDCIRCATVSCSTEGSPLCTEPLLWRHTLTNANHKKSEVKKQTKQNTSAVFIDRCCWWFTSVLLLHQCCGKRVHNSGPVR